MTKEWDAKVYDLIEQHNAFSVCDKIGQCPQEEVSLKLHDEVPFLVWPNVI